MVERLFQVLRSKSVRNSGWIIGQQVFQMLLQLVVGILTARYLGPENYGTLNYTASFVAFFVCVTTLGMDSVVIKKLIEHPNEEGYYIGSCMALRFVASLFSIFSVCLTVFILNISEPLKILLAFLQSFQLSFRSIQILDSWFQRHLKSKYVSIGKMIACVLVSAYKIFLLATSKGLVWFAISNSLTDGVIALVEWIFYTKNNGQKLKFSISIGKEVLKDSYHFIISGLMVAIYSQMDRIMIGKMLTDMDVGLYTTASTICSMWVFVPTAIISSFQPVIMEQKNNGNERNYMLRLQQLYSGIIWLCIFVSLVVFFFAPLFIRILYGEAYLRAVSSLRIAIWYETFAMIGTARGIWILCERKNKYVKYYLFIGAFVNLVLNYSMIPSLGIDGAAAATLITQITTSLLAPLLFKGTRIHTKIVLDSFLFKWYRRKGTPS